MAMRLAVALVIVLLPAAALGQSTTMGSDQSNNGTPSYGGGSAYGSGSYSGASIDNPGPPPTGETRAAPPNLGGNYSYDNKQKPRPTR
jgi:hypothetical protein